MGTGIERGFTVIEVVLFLGVSGLLLIGILVATGSAVSDARFTDSMKGTESFLQRQYEEVVNGVNPRSASTVCGPVVSEPGTSNCLLIGKVINFQQNDTTANVYYVVGQGSVNTSSNPSTLSALSQLTLTASTVGAEQYELPWQARFIQGKSIKSSLKTSANTIAYLRSPISSQIQPIVFNATISPGSSLSPFVTTSFSDYDSANLCFQGADGGVNQYQGVMTINQGLGASTVSAGRVEGAAWSAAC